MEWLLLWIISLVGVAIGIMLVAYWMIWFRLAPTNRWFTFIEEGTAKIVTRGEAFSRCLIQWEDCIFNRQSEGDDKWRVIEGREPKRLLGGLRLYSLFYPLEKIYTYEHRWRNLHENGEVETHEKTLDYVYLKRDIYVLDLPLKEKGEGGTEDFHGMPMGIKMALPMRVVNPYIAVFRVRRWLPMIMGIIQTRLRRFVAYYRYKEDLLNMRAGAGIKEIQDKAGIPKAEQIAEGADLWEKFWEEVEEDFKSEGGEVRLEQDKRIICIYGVEISEKSAGFLTLDPSSDYRKYTTMAYEAEQKKKKIEIDAEARAAETMGTVVAAVAAADGRDKSEVQKEFLADPEAFYNKHQRIMDNIMTKLSIEGRSYLKIETPGATGVFGDFLKLVAAWQRMPPGTGGSASSARNTEKVQQTAEDREEESQRAAQEIEDFL